MKPVRTLPVPTLAFEESPPSDAWRKFSKACGGFDPKTRKLRPLKWGPYFPANFYLDAITQAIEAGAVDPMTLVPLLFESAVGAKQILAHIQEYFKTVRCHDRWWAVIVGLTEADSDFGKFLMHPVAVRKTAMRTMAAIRYA